jgi:CheY-like chemotaxis protein
MARGFSEQSGGGIHIESAPAKGTMVHLYFPATAAAKSLPSQDEVASIPPLEARSVRLLMVDDDAMVRDVLEDQMQDAGFVVTACGSGSEALAHLDHGEPVDALIADLSMPVMDGLTLIREARRRRPDLPAILLTGYSTNVADIGVDSDVSGPFVLLRKPIRGDALVEHVASLLKE